MPEKLWEKKIVLKKTTALFLQNNELPLAPLNLFINVLRVIDRIASEK